MGFDSSFHTLMKILTRSAVLASFAFLVLSAVQAAGDGWLTSYPKALKESQKTGKPILADFTGSDWCGFCIKLHQEVFDKPEFKKWAAKNVVLLEVDFPRRTPQPAEIRQQNAELQRKFSYIEGYPTILFLDSKGAAFGMYHYEPGGPVHWTTMAERLLKKKTTGSRALRFAPKSDGYPPVITKNLYAKNDFRGKVAPKLVVEKWLTGKAPVTKGKVVLIDFWATWCPPCRELIPEINEWQKKFGDDLVVIGVSNEEPDVIQKFMKGSKMAYNVAIDSKAAMMHEIDIAGIPHVLVITPDNIVRWQGFPQGEEEQLTEKVLKQIIDTSKKLSKVAQR